MEKKFKETAIPEDFSKALAKQNFVIGPTNIARVATVLFHGVARAMGSMKNTSVPKALVFRDIGNNFLSAAKVEFIPNGDDPSAGQWAYNWTFYEDDLKDCDCINANSNKLLSTYFTASGQDLYNLRFASSDLSILMMVVMLEQIISWLRENVTETEPATLTLEGVFRATAEVDKNGDVVIGMVPDGEMKVLIKDDSKIQEV